MKNVKLLLLMSLFFITGIGFSQNYVTYSPMSKTIDVNSGVEGTVDVLVNCYGSTSEAVFLNALQSCANNDGIFSTSYTNGSILTPGQNTIIRYKFKKTVTADTQIAYKFSTDGSCFQAESKMIKITVNYKAAPATAITNNSISGNQTVFEGQSASTISGSTPSGGSGTYNYSWQQKAGNGSWTIISGATSKNYSPGIPATTISYRRIVSSAGLTSTSNEVTITVTPVPLIQNNTITIDGMIVYGSAPTGGLGDPNSYYYSWVVIDQDGDASELADYTSQNVIFSQPAFARYLKSPNNFKLTRVVYSGSQRSFSNYVDIPHISDIQNNIISANGNNVTGSVPTGGVGNYNYSWAIYYTGDSIDFDETTKDLDLTSHLSLISGILQIDSSAKLVRVVTAGISSISNKLALNSITTTSLMKEISSVSTVYPNPTSDAVNFTTSSSNNQEIEIIVYSEGLRNSQSVFKGTVIPNQIVKWNIPSNYSKGIYYYKVISGNKEVKSGKILYQ